MAKPRTWGGWIGWVAGGSLLLLAILLLGYHLAASSGRITGGVVQCIIVVVALACAGGLTYCHRRGLFEPDSEQEGEFLKAVFEAVGRVLAPAIGPVFVATGIAALVCAVFGFGGVLFWMIVGVGVIWALVKAGREFSGRAGQQHTLTELAREATSDVADREMQGPPSNQGPQPETPTAQSVGFHKGKGIVGAIIGAILGGIVGALAGEIQSEIGGLKGAVIARSVLWGITFGLFVAILFASWSKGWGRIVGAVFGFILGAIVGAFGEVISWSPDSTVGWLDGAILGTILGVIFGFLPIDKQSFENQEAANSEQSHRLPSSDQPDG